MISSLFGSQERRRDPEDGQLRTFRELQQVCAGKYSEHEIKAYWENQCRPEQVPEDDRVMHNVVNDPFMTRPPRSQELAASRSQRGTGTGTLASEAGGQAQEDQRHTDLRQNPFLSPAASPAGPAAASPAGPPAEMTEVRREEQRADSRQNPYHSQTGAPAAPAETTNVRRDPFMTDTRGPRPASTGGSTVPSGQNARHWETGRPQDRFRETVVKAKRHWTEVACRLLGPGDPDRRATVRNILILAPWLLFMWVLLLWVLLRHYSMETCIVLTAILIVSCAGMLALWFVGKRWGPVSLLSLGVLCLIAVICATAVGHLGWHRYWRQYWWLQTGARTSLNTAGTLALGQSDSAVIGFWDEKSERTAGGTYVDDLKSAGFKDEHYYCVAPILSPATAEGSLVRVNFWAIGIDCCQRIGSFTCDDSRTHDGGYGMVMLEGGYPCPGCHGDKFRRAVDKAEAIHGLVSAPGALFVRWVRSPTTAEMGVLWKALLYIIASGFLAFGGFWVLGALAWYYGIGKWPLIDRSFEQASEGARQKLQA